MRFFHIFIALFLLSQSAWARDLYRTLYSDDPIRAHILKGQHGPGGRQSKDDGKFGPERDAFIVEGRIQVTLGGPT